ncbi:MAG: hypothetical protein ABF649_06930 [Bacillus sp. (in: firmicutes)]
MDKAKKSETNNQWASANVEVTADSKENKKSETDNQWASTNKKSIE